MTQHRATKPQDPGYLPRPYLPTIRKAITAAVVGAAGALGAAMLDGALTGAEALVATGTGLLAGVATWKVENEDD